MSRRTKLLDRAAAALSRGKYRKALEAYRELERLEPADAAWSRRVGEMCRHVGDVEDALTSFSVAVEKYARAGFLVKAIAVCKLILRIEPRHSAARQRLEELTEERLGGAPRRALASASSGRKKTRTLPPDRPLEVVNLRDTVPGATRSPADPRITLIPIDTSDFDQAFSNISGGDIAAALASAPLFAGLAAASIETLIDRVTLRELEPGEVVFREGEAGTEMFVIAEGEVRVVAGAPATELDRLGDGDFFGEIALISETPRSATIEATAPTQLLALGRAAVSELVEVEPRVMVLLLRVVRDRLLDRLAKTHPLFGSFPESERDQLAARFQLLEVEAGAALIAQGERSQGMYIVVAGSASVDRTGEEGAVRHLAELGVGDVIGEMSLLGPDAAIATVSTREKTLAVMLPESEFRETIMTHPQVLAYVAELAESRRARLERVARGEEDYEGWQLDLL